MSGSDATSHGDGLKELSDLKDTDLTAIADNYILKYNAATGLWECEAGVYVDANAIHNNVAGEINALGDLVPTVLDEIIIEDQSNAWAKGRCQISDIVALAGGVIWTEAGGEVYPTTGANEIVSTGGLTIQDSETHPLTIENDAGTESGTIIRENELFIIDSGAGAHLSCRVNANAYFYTSTNKVNFNRSIVARISETYPITIEDDTSAEESTIYRSLTDLVINAGTGGGISLLTLDDVTVKLGDAAGANYFQILDSASAVVLQIDSNGVISGGGTAVAITSTTTITNTLGDNAGAQSFIIEDSDNADRFTINSDGDTDWTLEAAGYVLIDADTTDHTAGSIFTVNAGINSATVDVVDLNINVGTALSAAEVVTGINIAIDGDGADNATSIIQGMILTNGGTSTGINRGLTFSANWDYEIYCDSDFKIGLDTADGTTSFEIWDSGDAKVFEIDSDGVVQGTLAGSEFETANDCACPVLTLDQNDVDDSFINFEGSNGNGAAHSVNDYTTGATLQKQVQVEVNGTTYWVNIYDAATS